MPTKKRGAARPGRKSKEFWRQVVAEYRSGTATQREVAERHGVSDKSLGSWCSRLRDEAPNLARIRLEPETEDERPSVVVRLRNGHSLQVPLDAGLDLRELFVSIAGLT
jgi:transposase-like protein